MVLSHAQVGFEYVIVFEDGPLYNGMSWLACTAQLIETCELIGQGSLKKG